jgi:hypothetical protein
LVIFERLGNSIAKPRKVKLQEGMVLLSGFPKEVANELEAYIAKFIKSEFVVPTENITSSIEIPKVAVPIKVLPNKAIGLVEKEPRQFKIVVIGYDCSNGEALIEEMKDAGDFKQHAISMFQQELFKRGLV